MYIKDLTRYTYSDSRVKRSLPNVLAFGWIDQHFYKPHFEKEHAPSLALNTLMKDADVINRYRGYHGCPFCSDGSGNGEVWLKSKSGKIYVAPALITHYVEEHGYKVPETVLEDFDGFLNRDQNLEVFYETGTFEALTGGDMYSLDSHTSAVESIAKQMQDTVDKDILSRLRRIIRDDF